MKYSKSYKDYNPMIEKQPPPDSPYCAAAVGIIFGALLAVMYMGWVA